MSSQLGDDALMGLHTWVPEVTSVESSVDAVADIMVDIIAIQGLGANPYFTWVRKIRMENNDLKEVMWLRDLLPTCIQNARIATFSYQSDWFTYRKGVKTSLRELGEQLLNVLDLDRKKWNATHRPIIFIGHSMGGLALVLASNRPEFQNIKFCTAGIVFLGTPHGGTDLAGYASFIAKLKGNDSTLVQSLKSSDENLLALSNDFAFGYKHLSIMCFYETMQNRYLGGHAKIQVVEQHSAVWEGENMMYLNTDHSGLNKFSGYDDPNFKLVRSVIEKMVWEIPRMNSTDKKTDFPKLPIAKGASFDSHIEEHNSRCLANTRVELQHQIKEWAKDKHGKTIYWLNGMAGTGKSTIARTIARSLADEGQLGASFFFKKGEGDRGTASRFFTTITTDLMAHVPGLISRIKNVIDADPAIPERTLKDQFEKLILQPFLDIKQASTKGLGLIIVIDALDECEREKDIQVILQLLARTKSLGPVSLRVFVTSRPDSAIRLGFKKMRDGTYQDLIIHDIPKETIEHDIALFLEHELRVIGEERSLPLDWPSKTQIRALVDMAIPLFIFAATACRYIGDKKDNPKKRLERVLQYRSAKQVSQLDKMYLPILKELFDEEDEPDMKIWTSEFQEIVGSIVVLECPLSITSLANLLNIHKEDISCRLYLLHSALNIPVDDDMPIRLLHLSFRNFLVDITKRGKYRFWVNEKETHKKLASKCLQLLSSPKGLRQNICNLKMPGTRRSEVNGEIINSALSPEVQYACRYWALHLKYSGGRADENLVHIFLKKYFLYWLETMSLMGDTSESIHIINILLSLTDTDKSTAISGFLRDAKRFLLRNRSILADAPLQIYSSALIFTPELSIVRTTFKDHIPIWIARLSKVQKDWNALIQTLEGHSSHVSAVAFSPDGQLVASASHDKTVRLWNKYTGSCHSRLKGHSDWVRAVAFSPNGELIASASNDSTVRLWDVSTASCRHTLEGHLDGVRAVAFSPDGQLVASASDDHTVRLWDAGTGSCRNTLEGHSEWVRAVAFSPDGQLVASASADHAVRLWDVYIGSCHNTLEGHSRKVRTVAFSPDGQHVASGSDDNTVRLWDAGTGYCRNILKGHSNRIIAVAFSPHGQLVASASLDSTVRLWDVGTGSCRNTLEGHSDWLSAVAFSPDGNLVASASIDNTVRLWDADTGFCCNILEDHFDRVTDLAFSPGGQQIASASFDNTVRLWDTSTAPSRGTPKGHLDRVIAVAFSPDGQLVASASTDNTVCLWNADTGFCYSKLEGHSDWVNAVAFSPDGHQIASASIDNTVRLWDAGIGSCRSTLKGHSDWISAIAFSPDGHLLASASGDNTVRLWDAGTGNFCCTLTAGSIIRTLAFSPDVSHLNTDIGNIFIPSSLSIVPSLQNNKPAGAICVDDQWVLSNRKRFLWLPRDYQPSCTAVCGNLVCLGHESGKVTIIEFNF